MPLCSFCLKHIRIANSDGASRSDFRSISDPTFSYELHNGICRSGRRPAVLEHEVSCLLFGLCQGRQILHQSNGTLHGLRHIAAAKSSPGLHGQIGGLAEIEGMRPQNHGRTASQGLDQILPAQGSKLPPISAR